MTWDAAVYHLESHQFAGNTFALLLLQHGAVDEILSFHKLGNPAQTGLDGRSGIIQIVAVQAEAHLQAERVAGTQPDGFNAKFGTCLEDGIPNLQGSFGIEIQFETSGTGIARVGNDDIRLAGKFAVREVIVRNGRKVNGSQFLQCFDSQWALYG